MSNPAKQKPGINDELLSAKGFQKIVKDNGLILFSKRIPGTGSDFIVMKAENGLFYAPQIQPDIIMLAIDNQDNLLTMNEVNSYYQIALKKNQK